jgi:hypothetical protein
MVMRQRDWNFVLFALKGQMVEPEQGQTGFINATAAVEGVGCEDLQSVPGKWTPSKCRCVAGLRPPGDLNEECRFAAGGAATACEPRGQGRCQIMPSRPGQTANHIWAPVGFWKT